MSWILREELRSHTWWRDLREGEQIWRKRKLQHELLAICMVMAKRLRVFCLMLLREQNNMLLQIW
jgi:hypothetical protein